MRAPLPCVSMACLLFMRLPWPEGSFAHSTTCSWPLMAWISLWTFILYFLLLSWVGPCLAMGFSFSKPFLTLFASPLILLPCHLIIPAMLLLNLCLLGLFWAYCILSFCSIPVAQHYHWTSTVLGFLGPFHSFGPPRPISSPWASSGHSNSSFPWTFTKSFGLPWPKLSYHLLSSLWT